MGSAEITLFGLKDDDSIVFVDTVEGGNKVIANTGLISMWGIPRSYRSRLLKTVNPNDT
jgi:hypothetical protein